MQLAAVGDAVSDSADRPANNGGDLRDGSQRETRVRIYASSRGDLHVVRLVGEVDLLDADRVRDVLVEQAGSAVVLDLTDLRFIDAAGVAGVLEAYRRLSAAGHELAVRGARGIVRRVFEVTELGYLLQD